LYGNQCRAHLPIHQLRNLESCRREFRNSCPFDRREPVMRFCEIETGKGYRRNISVPKLEHRFDQNFSNVLNAILQSGIENSKMLNSVALQKYWIFNSIGLIKLRKIWNSHPIQRL
jgi:hypothetical protein